MDRVPNAQRPLAVHLLLHGAARRRFTRHDPRASERGESLSVTAPLEGDALTTAISTEMAGLYRDFYSHDRATATTYLNDRIVLCVLEDILTTNESRLVKFGGGQEVLDGRVAFQTETEDQFTAMVERLTGRRVVAFLSANQTTPGCACELFFLDAPPDASEPGHVSPGPQR